jgi:hypothetical protein
VQPACLPSKDFSYPDVNSQGYIVGWGLTKNADGYVASNVLQNAPMTIIDASACLIDDSTDVKMFQSKICLG